MSYEHFAGRIFQLSKKPCAVIANRRALHHWVQTAGGH